jgi:hypothetical protein
MMLEHFTNADGCFLVPLLVGLLAATIYRTASKACIGGGLASLPDYRSDSSRRRTRMRFC